MKRTVISRRTVLRGLGVSIGLPLLEGMVPAKSVLAGPAAPTAPLRMAFLCVPNGMHMADWTPKTEGANFELTPTLEALKAHKDCLTVLSGLTLDGARAHGDGGGDHARSGASFLTGAHPRKTDGADIRNGISVDQVAAEAIAGQTRFPSLELGLEGSAQSGGCDSGYSCAYSSNLSWRNETSPLAKEIDPGTVFDRLFGSTDPVQNKQNIAARQSTRKSVLDFALEDARQLRRDLGIADQRKLDEYLYAVRDVENRLLHAKNVSLDDYGRPNYPRPAGVPKKLDDHMQLMADMMVLAFQTDSTRILSFMMFNEGSPRGYPEIGVAEGHHDLSHHGGSHEKQEKVAKINRYHIGKLAYFLDSLAAVREGEGTLLDNCMIVYGSGISDGDRHNHDDLPILLCGKAGGRIPKGRHLRYAKDTPLCDLYVWMLQEFGVKTEKFGDSSGRLDGLS